MYTYFEDWSPNNAKQDGPVQFLGVHFQGRKKCLSQPLGGRLKDLGVRMRSRRAASPGCQLVSHHLAKCCCQVATSK